MIKKSNKIIDTTRTKEQKLKDLYVELNRL